MTSRTAPAVLWARAMSGTGEPDATRAPSEPSWPPADPAGVLDRGVDVAEGRMRLPERELPSVMRGEVARVLQRAPEALLDALDRILVGEHAPDGLRLLERTGVLGLLLPEVQSLVGFHRSCPAHHKDLWDHTLRVLDRLEADADLRWAALMHDAGKVPTRRVDERGRVQFLRHERVGAWYLRGVAGRLAMPSARTERIAFVIEQHGRVNAYAPDWSDRAVRRLMREAGEALDDLLAFSRADFTTGRRERARRIRSNLRELEQRVERIRREASEQPLLPRGLGHAVRDELGIRPGPELGDWIAWLRERVGAGELPPRAATEVYLQAVRERVRGGGRAEAPPEKPDQNG